MATAEEVKELSTKVSDPSQTIVNVGNTQAKNLALFKEFFEKQRKELSASISGAAEKLDKSSRVNSWLTAAIALFALVEAGSIFYGVTNSPDITHTDCIAVSEALFGNGVFSELPTHEQRIASYLQGRASVDEYVEAHIACQRIAGD
jgi:hypothetical protein